MSVESVARALNVVDERLTAAQKLVLVGIANHDGDGGAWPAMATLARYAGLTVRSAQRAVSQLADLGYVDVQLQAGGTAQMRADRRPNRYVLQFDGVTPVSPRDLDGVTPACHPAQPGDNEVRGDIGVADGVTPTSPEPSSEPPISTSSSVSTGVAAAAWTDDDYQRTISIIVAAKVAEYRPSRPKAYGHRVHVNTHIEDGDLIRRMLSDGTPPETVALFVLGHGGGAFMGPTVAIGEPARWCARSCMICRGDAWIYVDDTGCPVDHDTEHAIGPVPCPERSSA